MQPIVTAEVGPIPSASQFRNVATTYRLEDYMRFLERRSNNFNRGASQETIERFTFPHKYKRVSIMVLIEYHLKGRIELNLKNMQNTDELK